MLTIQVFPVPFWVDSEKCGLILKGLLDLFCSCNNIITQTQLELLISYKQKFADVHIPL